MRSAAIVSSAILFEVSDPRVRAVTVLGAEVSHDMRQATVHVSIMGTETEQNLAMRGLQHASGFLQAKVAARLQTRFTPVLSFKRDDSVKKSFEITKLIDEAIAADRKLDPAAAVEPSPSGEDDEPAEDET